MRRLAACLVTLALLTTAAVTAQVGQTGLLTGLVVDENRAPAARAVVTVSGETIIGGTLSTTTEDDGTYRLALPPGTYSVQAASGRVDSAPRTVRVRLGEIATLDLRFPAASGAPAAEPAAPLVDVRSSASPKHLPQDLLEYVPFVNRFGPAAMLLAPAVNPTTYSVYGSGGSSGNAYADDGVNASDPMGGTVWLFTNHNWQREVQVAGLGAPAEYGGFTGAASNSLLQSGGSAFHGLFEIGVENDALTDTNVSADLLEENADLAPGTTDYAVLSTFQAGGPLRRDAVWFFASGQYHRGKDKPAGYPASISTSDGPQARLRTAPGFLFKPTAKLSESAQLTAFVAYDAVLVDGFEAASNVLPEATLRLEAPTIAWNAVYTKVLSPSSVLDVQYSGFDGSDDRTPYHGDASGWYDLVTDQYSRSAYYSRHDDRLRHEARATLTRYASALGGRHDLKFGGEFEDASAKTAFAYSANKWIQAANGVPDFAYFGNASSEENAYRRYGGFAQDSWALGRVTINPGVRLDAVRGRNAHLDRTVFSTTEVSPRIGLAFAPSASARTVIRAHYGIYHDGPKTSHFRLVDPSTTPLTTAPLDPATLQPIGTPAVISPGGSSTSTDDSMKQPRMREAVAGVEHVMFGLSVTASAILRQYDRIIDDVLSNGAFTTRDVADPGPDGVTGTSDDPARSLRTYRQTNDPAANQFLITNPDGASRTYTGVEIVATRRWDDRWMMQASWAVSSTTGNADNVNSQGSSEEYDDPNQDPRFQPLRDGHSTLDNTHIAKGLAAYRGPWGLILSGAAFYTSGDTFARTVRLRLPQGLRTLMAEPRGSQRLEAQRRFDVKIEKQFAAGGARRIGVTLEGFNVANDAAVTARVTRSGATYLMPLAVVPPRSWRVGAVYRF